VERYKAAALVDAETQRDQLLRQAGSEEADKLKSLGFSQQEVIEGAKDAIRKAQPLAQKLYQEVLDNAPKEPEVEYTDESLDPTAMVKLERSPSIDEFYEYEMSKLERGEQV
jgi:hypothetical protein